MRARGSHQFARQTLRINTAHGSIPSKIGRKMRSNCARILRSRHNFAAGGDLSLLSSAGQRLHRFARQTLRIIPPKILARVSLHASVQGAAPLVGVWVSTGSGCNNPAIPDGGLPSNSAPVGKYPARTTLRTSFTDGVASPSRATARGRDPLVGSPGLLKTSDLPSFV